MLNMLLEIPFTNSSMRRLISYLDLLLGLLVDKAYINFCSFHRLCLKLRKRLSCLSRKVICLMLLGRYLRIKKMIGWGREHLRGRSLRRSRTLFLAWIFTLFVKKPSALTLVRSLFQLSLNSYLCFLLKRTFSELFSTVSIRNIYHLLQIYKYNDVKILDSTWGGSNR